jgi:glycosyltransferase involved in cell wall biosynthesis
VGSIPEVIVSNKNGILLRDTSPENIASTLKSIAVDREFSTALSRNARISAVERFSLNVCVQQHVAAFAQALRSEPAATQS